MDVLEKALARLESSKEPDDIELATEAMDQEVLRWCQTGECQSQIQIIGQLRVDSWIDAQKLAEKVAAACNGALLQHSEFGYLIFECDTFRFRTNLDNRSSPYISTNDLSTLELATISSVGTYLWPKPTIRISPQPITANGRNYLYFRLTPGQGAVSFCRRVPVGSKSDWRIISWHQDGHGRWRPAEVTKETGGSLFLSNLKLSPPASAEPSQPDFDFDDLPRGDNDPAKPAIIEEDLKKYSPASLSEFIKFLTISLLRNEPAERAVVAQSYATIAGVCEEYQEQIAKLLLGLLLDESRVAICCLESLKQLGDASCFYVLRHLWDYLVDPTIRLRIVPCLGELAPGAESLEDIKALWLKSDGDFRVKEKFDEATDRLYQRFQIERFDQNARDELVELLHRFDYALAAEFLDRRDQQICLKVACRAMVKSLVQYGRMRMNYEFIQAHEELKRCLDEYEGVLSKDEIARPWFQNRIDELYWVLNGCDEEAAKLLEMLARIEDLTKAGEISDFLTRVYNFVEQTLLYIAGRIGIPLEKRGDLTFLNAEWVDCHPQLTEVTETSKKNLKKQKLNRYVLKKIIPFASEGTTTTVVTSSVDGLVALIDGLEKLIEARNLGQAGHDKRAIFRQWLIEFADMSPEDALEKLNKLLDMAIGQSVRLSPYHSLNADIQRLLRWADGLPVTIDDIGD